MSLKTPIIPTLTLKGLDAKIQVIQLKMITSLSWLNKSFGLSDRIVEMRGDQIYVYPAAYESNVKNPIPMTPSDIYSAFSFWVKNGDTTFELNENFPPKDPLIKHLVSCIFYIDIHKIDDTVSYKETKSKLIEDIFHFFNTVQVAGMLVAKRFIEDDITKVYDGFTLDQIDNKFKMYPKWCCRMDFELTIRDDCYVANTYGSPHYTADTTLITADDTLITADQI
jgi:uncharacterized protein YktB (UPF0637 family)